VNPTVPPLAYTPLEVEGVIRCCPDDFCVEERAAFEPTRDGEHLFLHIEKRGLNSNDVAVLLARNYGVAPVDVSFAGMKDRHAVTRQWFSVRTNTDASPAPGTGWHVIETTRHRRKLRRGELAGNAFRIRVRKLTGDVRRLPERLDTLRSAGTPNYFGDQRFGRDAANVARAKAWVCRRPRAVVPPFQKGLHLSTARALLFNAVLGSRVEAGNWNRLVDGDVPLDSLPTGPLWGRGRPLVRGTAFEIEAAALAAYREWLDPLEHLGLAHERRSLVLKPAQFDTSIDDATLELRFELPPGQYATALLRELGTLRNAATESAA
jgi:tRNA pseudouridine13 synthase